MDEPKRVRGGQQVSFTSTLPKPPTEQDADGKNDPTLSLFRGIHEELIGLKPTEEYKRLKDALSLGNNALDVASIARSIDEASKNYLIASTLYYSARKHLVLYRIVLRRELAALRSQARKGIKALRAADSFEGRTTNDAIEDYVAQHFGEQYGRLIGREQDLENIRDTLESLRDAWRERIRQLNGLNDLEKRRPSSPSSGTGR